MHTLAQTSDTQASRMATFGRASTVAENDEVELDESAVPTQQPQQPTDRIGYSHKALQQLHAIMYS